MPEEPERSFAAALAIDQAPPVSFRARAVSSTMLHYATVLLVSLLNGATVVVLVRGLSVEEYGTYNVLTGLVVFGNLMTSFGIGPIIQRFLPEYVASGRAQLSRRLVGSVVSLKLLSSLVFAMLLWLSRDLWLAWVHLPTSAGALVALTLVVFLVAVEAQLLGDGVLVSLLDHAYWGAARVGAAALRLALFAWALERQGGVRGVLLAWLVTECLLLGLYGVRLRARLPSGEAAPGTDERLPVERLARFGAYLYFHNVGFFLRDKTADVFVIAYFLGSYGVGLYGVAFGIAALLLQFSPGLQLRAIMTSLMVERHVTDPSPPALRRQFAFLAKLTFFVGMPIFVFPAVLSREVIVHLLNPQYAGVATMFAVSLGFVAIQQMAYVFGPPLATLEKSAVVFWANILAVYNLAMDVMLIPLIGVWGAVLATGSGGTLLYVYYAVLARRLCGLSQPWKAYLRCAVNLAVAVLALYALRPLVDGLVTLVLVAALGGALYLGLCAVNRIFSAEERELVNGLLGRRVWVF